MTPSMTRLVQELMRLPGIGERTAGRLAFHVLRADRTYAEARRRTEETLAHPMVQAAVEIFGAEVRGVRDRRRP